MGTKKTKTIGEVIKEARMKLNLTADDVAKACNVSRSRLYQWEACSYITPKNFRALSAALHVPVRRLKEINGNPPGV